MKNLFTILTLLFLLIVVFLAWQSADADSRGKKFQEQFLSAAESRAAENLKTPETSDTSESLVVTTPEATAETTVPETTAPETTAAETTGAETTEPPVVETPDDGNIVLVFGGDVVLDPDYSNFSGAGSTAACIDASLLGEMLSADIFMHGNVFALTDSTTPINKAYVFRAPTADAAILKELGTDIVSLANNHTFDYGEVGLADTMATLTENGIAHVGAGLDEAAAGEPYYIDIKGKRIAFTAAMRSEKYPKTPAADGDDAGVMKMYDLAEYLEIIREAKANADIVVAYAHWGVENTIWLEQEQIDGARALIDAGADIVVGAHSHVLQTVEYYNGKPIFYGLGDLHGAGGLAKIAIAEDGSMTVNVIAFNNVNGVTTPLSGNDLWLKLEELDWISGSTVNNDGSVTE